MSLCVQFSRGPQGTDFKVLFFDYYQTYQHGSQDWWWLSQCSPQAATGHLPSISKPISATLPDAIDSGSE